MSEDKNYRGMTTRISRNTARMRQAIPEVMKGFAALSGAALADGALDKKTKELIALAIGVSQRCDGCIGYHTQALARLGATREEVMETLGMTVYMGGGPALMYAADAVEAFEQALEERAAQATQPA